MTHRDEPRGSHRRKEGRSITNKTWHRARRRTENVDDATSATSERAGESAREARYRKAATRPGRQSDRR
eukprot:5867620-Alexandrium_andersonii.AAC.1